MRHPRAARHSTGAHRLVPVAALVLAAGFVLVPSAALAQRRQFGAKAGPTFTSIVLPEDTGQDFHRRMAATVVGFFVQPLNPRLAMQFEAAASPKGTRLKDGTGLTQTLLLQYVELPVLLRVGGPHLAGAPLYFIGGPFVGFRVSAKEQFSTLAGTFITGVKTEVNDTVKTFESGVIAGAGVDIGKYMVVEGRYSRGLTDVNNVEERIEFTNHGFSITAGVRF